MQGIYVTSDLANLLRAYLDKYQIEASSIRHQLAAWPPHAQMPMKVWWQLLEEMQLLLDEPALGIQGNRKLSLYFNRIGFLHESHHSNQRV
jgi:hypothetical protein